MKNFHVSSLNLSYDIDQSILRFLPKDRSKTSQVSKNRKYEIVNKNAPSESFLAHREQLLLS